MLIGSFCSGYGGSCVLRHGHWFTLPVYREHLNYRVMSVQRNRVSPYRSSEEVESRKADNDDVGIGNGRKRKPPCNGTDRGCVVWLDNITSPETEQTSRWCSNARPSVEPMKEAKQMTTAQTVGAASHTSLDSSIGVRVGPQVSIA